MTKTEQILLVLIRMLLIFLGSYVVLGWLLTNPEMVKIIPGSTTMVLNTAICFLVSGVGVSLRPGISFLSVMPYRWIPLTLASFLVLLPTLVLIEIIGGIDLGIDAASLHVHVLDRNPNPGRMAPNTCIGFILAGIAFVVCQGQPSRSLRRILYVLGGLVFIMGFSSLLDYLLKLDWLYHFFSNNRMSIATALGLTLLGVGILIIGHNLSDPLRENRQDVRITRVAAVIMILLALTSGLAGFVTLKQGTDQFLQEELLQKAKNAVESIIASLERQVALKDALLSFPVFENDLETLPEHPDDVVSKEHLGKVIHILFDLGFSGVELRNVNGNPVFSEGVLSADKGMSFPIKVKDHNALLIWNDAFILRSEKPVTRNGTIVGTFITEQKLTGLDRLFKQLRYAGDTTDAVLCNQSGGTVNCFPSRFVPYLAHVSMFTDGRPSFPVSHAMLGEVGTIYANDIRGVPVLASFAPVGDTGLGIVVKIETVEFYSFVRQRLHILLAVLAFLVGVGIFVLRFQLQPLASRLVQSEQKTRRNNDVLAEDAEWLNRIVAIQNKIALAPFEISAILQTTMDNVQIVTHSAGAVIEMVEGEELFYRATSGAFADFTHFRLNIKGSLSGHCISSREMIRCDDTETDVRTDKNATRKLNIRSMIVAPLLHEGKAIGVLKTAGINPNAFNAKDERALQLLSGLIGSAIGHQQDYEDKKRLLGEKSDALNELERTTEILRSNEERTRIIIESAHDAFVGMDGNGRITDWNMQAERLFGLSRNQVLGKYFTESIISPTSQTFFTEQLALILAPEYRVDDNQRLEMNVTHFDGNEFIVEMTLSPIRTSQGVILTAFLHDITERKLNQEKLTQLAQYDGLTGLPNRALFMDRLSVAVLRVGRAQRAMALMFLDLDGFKRVNDEYGHQVGDAMLKIFAQRLTSIVRKADTVGRLGGDEFTIILENLIGAERDAQTVAGKIVECMMQPFDIAGEKITVTTSIGIAITRSSNKNVDELIKYADAEMYKAKKSGKNQFSLMEI